MKGRYAARVPFQSGGKGAEQSRGTGAGYRMSCGNARGFGNPAVPLRGCAGRMLARREARYVPVIRRLGLTDLVALSPAKNSSLGG